VRHQLGLNVTCITHYVTSICKVLTLQQQFAAVYSLQWQNVHAAASKFINLCPCSCSVVHQVLFPRLLQGSIQQHRVPLQRRITLPQELAAAAAMSDCSYCCCSYTCCILLVWHPPAFCCWLLVHISCLHLMLNYSKGCCYSSCLHFDYAH
jgi:hypothetical protein